MGSTTPTVESSEPLSDACEIRVDRPGTYTFVCSVPGHAAAGMEGALVVE